MGLDIKLVLVEISKLSKRFDEMDSKLETHLADQHSSLESRLAEREEAWGRKLDDLHAAQDARVKALEQAAGSFDDWRPGIEGTVDDIKLEVGKLNKLWSRSLLDRDAPVLPTAPSATERTSARGEADKPSGHRVDSCHWADGFGSITTVVHPPVKGTSQFPDPVSCTMNTQYHRFSGLSGHEGDFDSFLGRLPKLHFPNFDGDNPKLWLSRTVDFMELYRVPPSSWVKLASLQIVPLASRWLPSVEHKMKSCSWDQFAKLVLDRFGREHHELLVRQFLSIRQTSSVSDYIERFLVLADQLVAYESQPNPVYFTMRFIDGLTAEIRAAVLIHRPPDLDTLLLSLLNCRKKSPLWFVALKVSAIYAD